jgi:hypothetical protein
VRLLNAHLKDKEFDPRGQTEMRRTRPGCEQSCAAREPRAPDTGLILAVCANDTPIRPPSANWRGMNWPICVRPTPWRRLTQWMRSRTVMKERIIFLSAVI